MSDRLTTLRFPRLRNADGPDLNESLFNVGNNPEFVAVVDEQLPDDHLESAIAGLSSQPHLTGILIIQQPDSTARTDQVPAWTTPLIPVNPLRAAVFRRDRLDETQPGGFLDVQDPLRQFFARLVSARCAIATRVVPATAPDDSRLPPLRPDEPTARANWILDAVENLPLQNLLGHKPSNSISAAIKAGFLQINDFLDASHDASQSVQGRTDPDCWHAIMHRREPDYPNSKYWFRRVGTHPIFEELAAAASSLLESQPGISAAWKSRLLPAGAWDPFAFVDLCESCPRNESDELSLFARKLQWVEMQLLLRHAVAG